MIPDTIFEDRYRIERELGRGGMATVWLAEDLKHGRKVALKVMRPEASAAIGAERFRREIAILARLAHPHIVVLHDSGGSGDTLWYVMPWVPGESLRARLAREGPLPLAEAARLAREIASGLGHAHRAGVVHRDIKPENVLLSEGLAQVADFGIARQDASSDDATSFATAPQVTPGTLRYMAPEQLAGAAVDARTDLYALGCVLSEMLGGAAPFTRPPEGVPGTVAAFLARALAPSPDARFQTAAEFVEALTRAVEGSRATRLPRPRSRFIGREPELAACRAALAAARLLTLIGVGGTGKTRLALRLAEESPGAAWVDLAPIADAMRVIDVVADAVGAPELPGQDRIEAVRERLRAPGSLLVLDNCEHVLAQAGRIADALTDDVRILATSREPLGVPGERTYALPPLALPDDRSSIEASDAGRLFVERVRAVQPDWTPSPKDADAVREICRRLDGNPLALELAAARVRVLSLEQVRARLDDRFRLLGGGAQPLAATVQWSYDQLDPADQALFRALSTFAGGWTLATAHALAPGLDEFALIDALARLAERSLVVVAARGDEPRYGMLETLRQFGRERAAEAGETRTLQDRHAAAFRALAEEAYDGRFDEAGAWGERLEADHDNIAAALAHLAAHDSEGYLALAGALPWFWQARSHFKEGRAHLTAALAAAPVEPVRPARARALWGAAMMLAWQGAPDEARRLMEESLAMLRALGDRAEIGLALEGLGWTRFVSGEDEASLAAFEECLALERELGDPRMIARARAGLGQALVALHRTAEARRIAEEIIEDGAARGDRRNEHFGWHFLADCALIEGRCADSLPLYRRSLELARRLGDNLEIGFEVQGVAMSLAGLGEATRAVRLGAAVEAEFARIGADLHVNFWNELVTRFIGAARDALGGDVASRAHAEGSALTLEQAIAESLDPDRQAP